MDRTSPAGVPAARETCSRCGASFGCGMGQGSCWCAELPPLMPVPRSGEASADGDGDPASCLCPPCLREEIARRQAAAS